MCPNWDCVCPPTENADESDKQCDCPGCECELCTDCKVSKLNNINNSVFDINIVFIVSKEIFQSKDGRTTIEINRYNKTIHRNKHLFCLTF